MKTIEKNSTLQPQRFIQSIQREPGFVEELPDRPLSELEPQARREHLQRAVAAGALSIAERFKEDRGDYDLDASLYRLVGSLNAFHEGSRTISELRERYGNPRKMPPEVKNTYYQQKAAVTEFNHTLHEVLNNGASKFNFDELLTFMTNMHAASGNQHTTKDFYTEARETLIGMRNEMAVEQLLIAGGYEYTLGSLEQDSKGGDVIINGISIDVKASHHSAEQAKEKARRENRNPDHIVWSHVDFTDFNGELTLPYKAIDPILTRLRPDLDRALSSR